MSQLVKTSVILQDERSGLLAVPRGQIGLDLNQKMRAILVDWLMEVARMFRIRPDSIHKAINILDATLVRMPDASKANLQLIGLSSLALAATYEEIYHPDVAEYVGVSDSAFTADQLNDMCVRIFKLLGCSISMPTEMDCLRLVSKHTGADLDRHSASKHLIMMSTLYTGVMQFLPSVRATACSYISQLVLGGPEYANIFNIPVEVVKTCATNICDLAERLLYSTLKAYAKSVRPGVTFGGHTWIQFLGVVSKLGLVEEPHDRMSEYMTNTYTKLDLSLTLLPLDTIHKRSKRLGKGTFGVVHSVEYKGVTYAVKTNKIQSDFALPQSVLREISIMLSLANDNVVTIHHITSDLQSVFLEMGKSDLRKWIGKKGPMSTAGQTDLANQLLQGLVYIHNCGVLHRDIKPHNIIVYKDGEGNPNYRLSDFGSSRGCDIALNTGEYTTFICTLWYRSPELLLGANSYGDRLDVWSMMCVLYECATGNMLFSGMNEHEQTTGIFSVLGKPTNETWPGVEQLTHYGLYEQQYDKKTDYFTKNKKLSNLTKRLLNSGLVLNPDRRPSAQDMYDIVANYLMY